MAYGTRRFNAAFTRAHQKSLSWAEWTQFFMIPISVRFFCSYFFYRRVPRPCVRFLNSDGFYSVSFLASHRTTLGWLFTTVYSIYSHLTSVSGGLLPHPQHKVTRHASATAWSCRVSHIFYKKSSVVLV